MTQLVDHSSLSPQMEGPEEGEDSDSSFQAEKLSVEDDRQLEADIKEKTGLVGHDEGCSMDSSCQEVEMD